MNDKPKKQYDFKTYGVDHHYLYKTKRWRNFVNAGGPHGDRFGWIVEVTNENFFDLCKMFRGGKESIESQLVTYKRRFRPDKRRGVLSFVWGERDGKPLRINVGDILIVVEAGSPDNPRDIEQHFGVWQIVDPRTLDPKVDMERLSTKALKIFKDHIVFTGYEYVGRRGKTIVNEINRALVLEPFKVSGAKVRKN